MLTTMNKKLLLISGLLVITGLSAIYFEGCNKTDHPLGINAPLGLDVPTTSPTPATGSIEVYVKDSALVSSGAVQGVSISLFEPGNLFFATNVTQPVVGYAAFNPSNLISGIWTAQVPSQSVSYQIISSGVTNVIKRTYGYSTIPITVSGGGQYAVTFATGGNIVSISPVSQTMTLADPDFLPLTITYSESGNLDIPVTVRMSGIPNLSFFTYLNPNTWQLGGGNSYWAAVTVSRTSCYSQTINLSLSATDLSGNSMPTTGAVITKGWSIPVTALMDKHAIGGGQEICYMQIGSTNDCGAALYSVSYQIGTSDPPGGTVYGPYSITSGQSIGVTYFSSADPYVRAIYAYPGGGQFIGDIQTQYLSFDSFSDMGNSTY